MIDERFLTEYENLLDKGYCNCNEMNCIDNNSPRRILNIAKRLQQENQKYKEVIDKLNNLNNRIIEEYKLNYGDNPSKLLLALNTISDILKEVE